VFKITIVNCNKIFQEICINQNQIGHVDLDSLRFLDVNDAALAHYGYTREEFLSMTLKDICPASEIVSMEAGLEQGRKEPGIAGHRQMIHQKKMAI